MFFGSSSSGAATSSSGSNGGTLLNSVTPHTSYDSLASFQSYSSSASSKASTPWNSGQFGAIGSLGDKRQPTNFLDGDTTISGGLSKMVAKRPSFPILNSSSNGQAAQDMDDMSPGLDNLSFLPSFPDKQGGMGLDRSIHSTNNPWNTPVSVDRRSSTSSLQGSSSRSVQLLQRGAENQRPSTSATSANSSGVMSGITSMEPAVEAAFQNMAKCLEEKEKTIKDLKLQLEATWTAICLSEHDKTALERNMSSVPTGDPTVLAHRMITRLQNLTEENKMLGQMLSYGRAAQKELELGALRRENEMLKDKLQQAR